MMGNIAAIPSMGSNMPNSSSMRNTSLTTEQVTKVTETLANFDANNLTESDAKAIVSAFSEAGIEPGKALAEAMSEAGFDAREVGEMAGVGPAQGNQAGSGMGGPSGGPGGDPMGGPPPPKQAQLNLDEESLEELNSLIEDYSTSDNEEEKSIMLSTIQSILRASAPEDGLIHVTA